MTDKAPAPPRDFTYINSVRRRPSEYEAVNLHCQPDARGGWDIDPGLVIDNGRIAWELSSTKLDHPDWYAFRDPAQLWQRSYVKQQAEQERSIERTCEDAIAGGTLADVDPAWLNEILGGHYRVWSFAEWGLFRASFTAARETLSDSLSAVFTFQAFDRLRHAQDVVWWTLALEKSVPGFSDAGAKDQWLSAPEYQPMRRVVEEIMHATDDWAEVAVAINLVFDPIVGEVGLSRLVSRLGGRHGDSVTPMIVRTAERDRRRNQAWTQALVTLVTADDVPAASENRAVIAEWIAAWTPKAIEAAQALSVVYDRIPAVHATPGVESFQEILEGAVAAQGDLVGALKGAGA
jgi:methane monooxygenase component A beta chain/propane monooxygenase small subunit